MGEPRLGDWWRETAERFLPKVGGQVERLAKDIAAGLTRDYNDFEEYSLGRAKLEELYLLLSRLQGALNPLVDEFASAERARLSPLIEKSYFWREPESVVWTFPSATHAMQSGEGTYHFIQVNREELEAVAQEYVRGYLGTSYALEKVLISALAYVEVIAYGLTLKADVIRGAAILFPNPTDKKLVGVRLLKSFLGWGLRCAVAIVLGALASDRGGFGVGVVVAFGAYVLLQFRALAAFKLEAEPKVAKGKLLGEMMHLSKQTSDEIMPPALMRRLLENTTDNGAVWPSPLWSLILAAERRCPWDFIPPEPSKR